MPLQVWCSSGPRYCAGSRNPERFRLLAVTERARVYVDTVTRVRTKHVVSATVRFVNDSALRPIGSLAAPRVTDLRAVVDCRGETVKDSRATYYDVAGASETTPQPSSWVAVPESTGMPWSVLGKDGTPLNDGARIYARVCWLFAPEYAWDLTPPKPKRGGR